MFILTENSDTIIDVGAYIHNKKIIKFRTSKRQITFSLFKSKQFLGVGEIEINGQEKWVLIHDETTDKNSSAEIKIKAKCYNKSHNDSSGKKNNNIKIESAIANFLGQSPMNTNSNTNETSLIKNSSNNSINQNNNNNNNNNSNNNNKKFIGYHNKTKSSIIDYSNFSKNNELIKKGIQNRKNSYNNNNLYSTVNCYNSQNINSIISCNSINNVNTCTSVICNNNNSNNNNALNSLLTTNNNGCNKVQNNNNCNNNYNVNSNRSNNSKTKKILNAYNKVNEIINNNNITNNTKSDRLNKQCKFQDLISPSKINSSNNVHNIDKNNPKYPTRNISANFNSSPPQKINKTDGNNLIKKYIDDYISERANKENNIDPNAFTNYQTHIKKEIIKDTRKVNLNRKINEEIKKELKTKSINTAKSKEKESHPNQKLDFNQLKSLSKGLTSLNIYDDFKNQELNKKFSYKYIKSTSKLRKEKNKKRFNRNKLTDIPQEFSSDYIKKNLTNTMSQLAFTSEEELDEHILDKSFENYIKNDEIIESSNRNNLDSYREDNISRKDKSISFFSSNFNNRGTDITFNKSDDELEKNGLLSKKNEEEEIVDLNEFNLLKEDFYTIYTKNYFTDKKNIICENLCYERNFFFDKILELNNKYYLISKKMTLNKKLLKEFIKKYIEKINNLLEKKFKMEKKFFKFEYVNEANKTNFENNKLILKNSKNNNNKIQRELEIFQNIFNVYQENKEIREQQKQMKLNNEKKFLIMTLYNLFTNNNSLYDKMELSQKYFLKKIFTTIENKNEGNNNSNNSLNNMNNNNNNCSNIKDEFKDKKINDNYYESYCNIYMEKVPGLYNTKTLNLPIIAENNKEDEQILDDDEIDTTNRMSIASNYTCNNKTSRSCRKNKRDYLYTKMTRTKTDTNSINSSINNKIYNSNNNSARHPKPKIPGNMGKSKQQATLSNKYDNFNDTTMISLTSRFKILEDELQDVRQSIAIQKNELLQHKSGQTNVSVTIAQKGDQLTENIQASISKMDGEIQKSTSHQKAENSRLDQQITQLNAEDTIIRNRLKILAKRIDDISAQLGTSFAEYK